MIGPNKNDTFPNENIKSVCYIKNIIKNPNIIIGDYTYYSDSKDPTNFESHVTHHYEFIGDKLIVGKFCAIGEGVEFIMNGANHRMNSITTYPFSIMANGWEKCTPNLNDLPIKGNTVVGNDVWIGQNVTILPGIKIGDGSIIGANSVVAKNVTPYTIVGGNPTKFIRNRFDENITKHLLKIKWWNWDEQKIFDNLEKLCSGNTEQIMLL